MHEQVTKNFTNNNININPLASACHKKRNIFFTYFTQKYFVKPTLYDF